MKYNNTTDASMTSLAAEPPPADAPAPAAVGRIIKPRLTASSSRLAANAAGAAVAGSAVSLAFFLSRKPTVSQLRDHAKFRA